MGALRRAIRRHPHHGRIGEPADRRIALVNDELLLVYRSLVWKNGAPGGGGPAEVFAKDQSLMFARRFTEPRPDEAVPSGDGLSSRPQNG